MPLADGLHCLNIGVLVKTLNQLNTADVAFVTITVNIETVPANVTSGLGGGRVAAASG